MSFDTDGCIASVVHTHMVAEKLSGRTAEVFYAAGISRDCVLRDMKHGTTVSSLTVQIVLVPLLFRLLEICLCDAKSKK
jgi:hypothetical protein